MELTLLSEHYYFIVLGFQHLLHNYMITTVFVT